MKHGAGPADCSVGAAGPGGALIVISDGPAGMCSRTLNPILRTFVLATIAVPIISYALMPRLHRLRRNLLIRTAGADPSPVPPL